LKKAGLDDQVIERLLGTGLLELHPTNLTCGDYNM
jgi:hypothetical protein